MSLPEIPPGIICLWYGVLLDIPTGWTICDGNNGTPDLRDKFLIGAGDSYSPGDTGGSDRHRHFFTSDGHSHPIQTAGGWVSSGAAIDDDTGISVAVGLTNLTLALPPYHALCYIMKT